MWIHICFFNFFQTSNHTKHSICHFVIFFSMRFTISVCQTYCSDWTHTWGRCLWPDANTLVPFIYFVEIREHAAWFACVYWEILNQAGDGPAPKWNEPVVNFTWYWFSRRSSIQGWEIWWIICKLSDSIQIHDYF